MAEDPFDRVGSRLYATTREFNRYTQLWLDWGELNGVRIFSEKLCNEVWTRHRTNDDIDQDFGLLWWLHPDEGGYAISGFGGNISALCPDTGVIVTVTRSHGGPSKGLFYYRCEKMNLLHFACRMDNG